MSLKILFFSDVHEDLPWMDSILQKELNSVDKVVIGGDFFDSYTHKSSIKDICKYLNELKLNLKEKLVTCLANHDAGYYFHYERAKLFKHIEPYNHFYCSGFTKSKAYDIAKYLSPDFIKETKLAHFEDGVLYTHAGARPELFKWKGDKYDVEGFLKECERLDSNFTWKFEPLHPFLQIGKRRGGRSEFGGLTWADWREHDVYDLSLPIQVFGHCGLNTPQQKGNNHCIDAKQTYYAIVTDGKVEYKNV